MIETQEQPQSTLALPLGAPLAPARAGRTEEEPRARRAPWTRSEAEWRALEPRGFYARQLRTPVLYALALLLAPLAAMIALPVLLINACCHGGLRRAFFLQERVGHRGQVFTLVKFRTMRDPAPGTPAGVRAGDRARVTRFGRFLRNTHLDELPQLLNVLGGEMTLIGPRPEMLSVERWACERWDDFSRRLVLRPGITGLAQITQGYACDGDEAAYRRKFELNMRYAEALGPGLDLAILARTALWMVRGRGWRLAPPAMER